VFGRFAGTFKNQASTAANTTSGKMKNLSIQMGEFKESIGAAVAPLIQKMLPALLKFSTFAQQNTKLIVTLGAVIGTFALAIIGLNAGLAIYNTIQALTLALNTALTASFSALWVATGAVVIIAIIAALVALQVKFDIFGKAIDGIKIGFDAVWGAIKFVFDWSKNNWPLLLAIITGPFGLAIVAIVKFKNSIISVLQGIKDFAVTIFDGIIGAYRSVMNGILSLMESGINKAISGLNAALDAVDKGAGPLVNFGKIPQVKIPRLAEGGIVTGPTIAMIGEAGPEAVIPLNRAGGMGLGGNTINITVTSADPNAVVAALQRYVRMSGPVPVTTRPL
jgi:phage-related protein